MKRSGIRRATGMKRGSSTLKRTRMKATNPARKAETFRRVYGSAERAQAIKALPCLVDDASCGGWVENAHVPSKSGAGRKGDACHNVPLCVKHHRTGKDSLHHLNKAGFKTHHGIDLDVAAAAIPEPRND